jgi:hypothetical protein
VREHNARHRWLPSHIRGVAGKRRQARQFAAVAANRTLAKHRMESKMGKSRIYEALNAGEVICDIGQVTPADRRLLDRLVRRKAAVKWRGYWFPIAGASHGIGPLKTCWALQGAHQ